jgi:hypothetical protein
MILPDIGHAKLMVRWNQVPGAEYYSVLIKPSSAGIYYSAGIVGEPLNPFPVSNILNGEVPSAIIDRFINSNNNVSFLTPGTRYDIKIKALDAFFNFRESDIVQVTPMDLPYITKVCMSSTTHFRFLLWREIGCVSVVSGLDTAQVFQINGTQEQALGEQINGYAAGGAFSIDFPQSGILTTAISPMELRVKISNSNGFLYSKFAPSAGSITDYFVYYPGMVILPCTP